MVMEPAEPSDLQAEVVGSQAVTQSESRAGSQGHWQSRAGGAGLLAQGDVSSPSSAFWLCWGAPWTGGYCPSRQFL